MSDSEQPAVTSAQPLPVPSSPVAAAAPVAARPVWPLALGLLLVAAAAGSGGWWLWQQQQAQQRGLEAQLAELRAGLNQRGVDLQKMELALAKEQGRRDEANARLQRDLAAQAEAITTLKLPQQQQWQLTEVAYLARLANRRLWYEQDVASAIALLSDADRLLSTIDGARVLDVRAALARDLSALRALPQPDFDGARLRLAGLQQQVDGWPLTGDGLLAVEAERPASADLASNWQQLSAAFFRIQRDDSSAPLLLPDQAYWLRENLRLGLQRAQLALQQRQQAPYDAALADLRDWLNRYMDKRSPEVAAALGELDALAELPLRLKLPERLEVSLVLAATASDGAAP
ncbi:MAG: uroporphyrinogen-III C-methyltransferase [Corallincola sp.]|nr:uroporphyrinogen-III C-methyltransferase [Corallincola sp.]